MWDSKKHVFAVQQTAHPRSTNDDKEENDWKQDHEAKFAMPGPEPQSRRKNTLKVENRRS
jgi:hypothetical protein